MSLRPTPQVQIAALTKPWDLSAWKPAEYRPFPNLNDFQKNDLVRLSVNRGSQRIDPFGYYRPHSRRTPMWLTDTEFYETRFRSDLAGRVHMRVTEDKVFKGKVFDKRPGFVSFKITIPGRLVVERDDGSTGKSETLVENFIYLELKGSSPEDWEPWVVELKVDPRLR